MDTLDRLPHDESMPPKLDEKAETDRVQLMISRTLIGRISAWRKRQEPIPNLSAAIRRLIEIALETEEERERSGRKQ